MIDALAVGADRIQRNFEPMQRQVEQWRSPQISDERAKLILCAALSMASWRRREAFCRKCTACTYPKFSARTVWSLSNAFTSAFKKLDPVPHFKATAKLGEFLTQLPA